MVLRCKSEKAAFQRWECASSHFGRVVRQSSSAHRRCDGGGDDTSGTPSVVLQNQTCLRRRLPPNSDTFSACLWPSPARATDHCSILHILSA